MGSVDKLSNANSHSGSVLTSKIPCICICVLLLILCILNWVYVGVSVWSATSWAEITNAGAFAFWHDMQTLRAVT